MPYKLCCFFDSMFFFILPLSKNARMFQVKKKQKGSIEALGS